jgi:Family of unknown function (DUF5825)
MLLDSLQVWRDYDREALRLGEFMRLDSLAPATDAGLLAGNVFDSGGRFVVIDDIMDFDALDPTDAARFFELLRELTAFGIAVEWRLRTSRDDTQWSDLWHLFPPAEVVIPAGAAGQVWEFWRRQFYFGLCIMRRGPGLIEVRDRRSGRIRCLRFTSPPHLAAIKRLENGAPASSIAPEVLAELEAARVVMAIGDMRLWLPCPFRRSPLSPVGFW